MWVREAPLKQCLESEGGGGINCVVWMNSIEELTLVVGVDVVSKIRTETGDLAKEVEKVIAIVKDRRKRFIKSLLDILRLVRISSGDQTEMANEMVRNTAVRWISRIRKQDDAGEKGGEEKGENIAYLHKMHQTAKAVSNIMGHIENAEEMARNDTQWSELQRETSVKKMALTWKLKMMSKKHARVPSNRIGMQRQQSKRSTGQRLKSTNTRVSDLTIKTLETVDPEKMARIESLRKERVVRMGAGDLEQQETALYEELKSIKQETESPNVVFSPMRMAREFQACVMNLSKLENAVYLASEVHSPHTV